MEPRDINLRSHGVDEITLDGGDQARDGKYKVTRYVKS